MAAELTEGISVEPKLIEGGNGIFDVKVDGKLVYSKRETKKFPDQGEVLRLIQGG